MGKKIRVWDGTAWQDVAPSLPYTAIHSAQASMPATGVDGQVWLDTDGTLADTAFVPLSGGTMTGNLNTPSINAGGISGQNYLLNGALDFWQRGTSTTAMNVYLADRWMAMNNDKYYRSTDVPTNQGLQYSAGWGFVAGSSFPLIAYRMSAEEAILFAGKTITLSFWGKNISGTAALYAEYLTPNATNNFSAVTNQGLIAFYGSPSSTWTKYTATFTATTDLVRGLEFRIVRGNQSASEMLTTGFKLEIGNQATPFTRANPDLGTELAACQRYYIKKAPTISDGYYAVMMVVNSTTTAMTNFPLPAVMRTRPTVAISGLSFIYGSGSNIAISSINNYSDQLSGSLGMYLNLASASILGSVGFIYGSGSSYIEFSSEL